VMKGCNILGVKNWQTLAALLAGATCNKKKSREQKSCFRIQRTTVLEMSKDSSFILDAIRRSFFTKSAATATMLTSVRVEFGRTPLSSSTSSLKSRNREYHLKRLIGSQPHYHTPYAPILVFLSRRDRL
jgi:hypothetical protein